MHLRGIHSAEGHCYLQYSQLYSFSFKITNSIDNLFTTILCSHTMSTNRSPPKKTIMAPLGGLFGSQWRADDNVGVWDNNAGNTLSKETQFRQPTKQWPPPPRYSYSPSQPPFPGAPQFYHPAPSNKTPSSQPSSGCATQGYQSYGQSWQWYDFPQGGYSGPQMFPPQQFTGQRPFLQAHLECLHHQLETFHSIGRHHPALLHTDNFPAHRGDIPIVCHRNDFSRLWNCAGQMLQGLQICPHCQRFLMTNLMQMLRVMIHRTWAGPKAKPQSACRKLNSPCSNWPKGWGSSTLVHSTSGRRYGWLGLSRRSIGSVSWDRTVWNRCEMDPWTGRRLLQIFWGLSRPGCLWTISIMPNGFRNSGWRRFWRNVQVWFGRRGRREGEATSDWRRSRVSAQAKQREVMSQSCQIQLSWL